MSCCYYNGAGNGSNCYELYNKQNLAPDLQLIACAAEEIVNTLGQHISYYVNTYDPAAADNLYGEHPTSIFAAPQDIKMYIQLTENALKLSRFGFAAEDDITGLVSIVGFTNAFSGLGIFEALNQDIEPKSGDVFQLIEYGSDRPRNRNGTFFEITERLDQDIATINPLGGHYLWHLKGKRLEYSFQPGIPGEMGNDQVYDDAYAGKLISDIEGTMTNPKVYSQNINADSANIFDQPANDNTGVYGTYSSTDTPYITTLSASQLTTDANVLLKTETDSQISPGL